MHLFRPSPAGLQDECGQPLQLADVSQTGGSGGGFHCILTSFGLPSGNLPHLLIKLYAEGLSCCRFLISSVLVQFKIRIENVLSSGLMFVTRKFLPCAKN